MKIGDIIKCARCGREIVAKNGVQKYCLDCRIVVDKEKKSVYMADYNAENPYSIRANITAKNKARKAMMKRLAARDAKYEAEFGTQGRINRPFKFHADQPFDECVRKFY